MGSPAAAGSPGRNQKYFSANMWHQRSGYAFTAHRCSRSLEVQQVGAEGPCLSLLGELGQFRAGLGRFDAPRGVARRPGSRTPRGRPEGLPLWPGFQRWGVSQGARSPAVAASSRASDSLAIGSVLSGFVYMFVLQGCAES